MQRLNGQTGGQVIRDILLFENTTGQYGYCVFNSTSSPETVAGFFKTIPTRGCSEIILASDGYPAPEGSLERSEEALQQIISQDPLCCRQTPSIKGILHGNVSYDDRSCLRFTPTSR